MILPDFAIREWAERGGVDPFNDKLINPASIDLCWSGRYRLPDRFEWGIEHSIIGPIGSLDIKPGQFVLLDTLEYLVIPSHLCGTLYLKSSIGRIGLEHHHAGLFDPGFQGTATLEISNPSPWTVEITKGQPLVQLKLEKMLAEPEQDYSKTGRYVGQRGPTPVRRKR